MHIVNVIMTGECKVYPYWEGGGGGGGVLYVKVYVRHLDYMNNNVYYYTTTTTPTPTTTTTTTTTITTSHQKTCEPEMYNISD